MRRLRTLRHEFVGEIPVELRLGTIYVSISFATAIHMCCCGCGEEVVTPIAPNDWSLMFDGETVSLEPSIGSWSLPCQSHYWIRRNEVIWARKWTRRQIEANRRDEMHAKRRSYGISDLVPGVGAKLNPSGAASRGGWLQRLRSWSK